MAKPTEDEIRAIVTDYENEKAAALNKRDERLRAAREQGWIPAALERATGYSRETVRKALNPEVRAALNASRRKA